LTKLDQALAKAKSLPELVNLRALVRSAVDHAKRIRVGNREEYNEYIERELKIARRAGEMLAKMEKNQGTRLGGNTVLPPGNEPTLAELNVTKQQSARWQLVARVPEQRFATWLADEKKAKRALTMNGLYLLARQLFPSTNGNGRTMGDCQIVSDLQQLIKDDCKFGCIYADPPWPYENRATRSNVGKEYKGTMTIEELCQEPVGELAADTCHLHLWVTVAFTRAAFELLDAWGFEFKSEIVWCKSQMGIGNYWRLSHEKMLLGVRGESVDVVFERGQKNHKSWLEANRGKHSEKPDAFRDLVEKVSPGPYLELYGRHRIPGWVVYGNQVEDQVRMC
jgi:N6-adenosine-specific RNA methylase IME4